MSKYTNYTAINIFRNFMKIRIIHYTNDKDEWITIAFNNNGIRKSEILKNSLGIWKYHNMKYIYDCLIKYFNNESIMINTVFTKKSNEKKIFINCKLPYFKCCLFNIYKILTINLVS